MKGGSNISPATDLKFIAEIFNLKLACEPFEPLVLLEASWQTHKEALLQSCLNVKDLKGIWIEMSVLRNEAHLKTT